MSGNRLQREVKKRQPFESLEQEATLNVLRTNDQLQIRLDRLFRNYALTPSQYNILRILRGEGGPLPILEIAARTITVVPGITGLIDRLERNELVERTRSVEDRRVIFVAITPKGLELLGRLDEPLSTLHRQLVGSLSKTELQTLISLLEKIRAALVESS